MRLVTHLLAGWAVAHSLPGSPRFRLDGRGRRLTVLAGLVPFVDGLPVFWNQEWFQELHHEYSASLPVGVLVTLLLAPLATRGRRLPTALACFLAFAANTLLDMVTTNWPVRLFFPFSDFRWSVGGRLSDFTIYTVIGTLCDLAFVALAALIYWRWGRTPFELFGERVDRLAIDFVRLPWRHRCSECGRRATYRCEKCQATVCGYHVRLSALRPRCANCAGTREGRSG